MPGNTPEGAAAGAQRSARARLPPEDPAAGAPAGAPVGRPSQMLNQYQIKGGRPTNRVVGQQQIQKAGGKLARTGVVRSTAEGRAGPDRHHRLPRP